MIVDTSVVVAIFFEEAEASLFTNLILKANTCRISAANWFEVLMVVGSRKSGKTIDDCDLFFRRANIIIEPITLHHAYLARQAFLDYGKGRHPAKLNFGDCFAYALAKATQEPLLYKGNDFTLTDIAPAN